MRREFENIEFLYGSAETLGAMGSLPALRPFDGRTADFLDALGAELRKTPEFRSLPDVAAFAFWCRRASVTLMEREYGGAENRLGRGVTLHFAPSNIPVLFAFSMAAGLLAGNCCAVKLPGARTPQAELICAAVGRVCAERCPEFAGRIALFRCGHDKSIADALTALCDVRVIWGGDASVAEIRRSPLPPRATELPFADRSSAAVIEAAEVLRADELYGCVRDFYNDTYLNDQNACSSPRIIYWLGTEADVKRARERFWRDFGALVREKYQPAAAAVMGKYTAALTLAALTPGASVEREGNYILRVSLPELRAELWDLTAPGGLFIEASGESLEGFLPILTGRCQTLCCFGGLGAELRELIIKSGVRGGDRIVPFGHSLDFGLVWDGHDLIAEMSREIITL